jgi:hypothetical protein
MVKTKILPGMSHGFLQMITFLPEGRQASNFLAEWIKEGFLEKTGGADDVTFEILNEMVEVETGSVLLRRRDSMASRIGFSRT